MAYIVRYIKQSLIDKIEAATGKPVSAQQLEEFMAQVRVESLKGAVNLVDHLRSTGCIASYYEEGELK